MNFRTLFWAGVVSLLLWLGIIYGIYQCRAPIKRYVKAQTNEMLMITTKAKWNLKPEGLES